ncbi:hypothetical protein M0D69_01500 [Caballeronia sp. SEWSISQ10-4 2]|uniref:hypothetical protein n=1 Tax=Caballeronia sp. SEWSISQ10-4 2 TaxID=2937438 RepID=UPI00265041C0|nr:hypothetical protein [Caballeronia sp. SEWSISQ10-4 2]MDN7176715.1 hypothetical protein [Caballeronia sp. SEWSISQ10-4 2]
MTNADSNTCSLLSGSGGLHCNSMQAFIALRLRAARVSDDMKNLNVGGSTAPSRLPSSSASASTLADALSRALSRESGRLAESMVLTATPSEHESVMRFVLGGTTAAAVLLLDVPVLFRIPRCDWETPLLRTRNRFSDDGIKLYAVLMNDSSERSLSGALRRVRHLYQAKQFARFCGTNGIGLLTNDETPTARTVGETQDGLASAIASALMSARYFCCGAFRIGKADSAMGIHRALPH